MTVISLETNLIDNLVKASVGTIGTAVGWGFESFGKYDKAIVLIATNNGIMSSGIKKIKDDNSTDTKISLTLFVAEDRKEHDMNWFAFNKFISS